MIIRESRVNLGQREVRIGVVEGFDARTIAGLSGEKNDLEPGSLKARSALFIQYHQRRSRQRHRKFLSLPEAGHAISIQHSIYTYDEHRFR
jgi:hypothetical protein